MLIFVSIYSIQNENDKYIRLFILVDQSQITQIFKKHRIVSTQCCSKQFGSNGIYSMIIKMLYLSLSFRMVIIGMLYKRIQQKCRTQ